MKIKQDFVTNSSSTSFIFIFQGTKRTDLFKQVINNEDTFHISYEPWQELATQYDVGDLLETMIGLIRKNDGDKYYLPNIYPLENLVETIEKNISDYTRYLEEEKKQHTAKNGSANDYIFKLYTENLATNKKNLEIVNRFIATGVQFSTVEISFGNDGIVMGNYGYAMEGLTSFEPTDEFHMIIENQH